MYEHKQKLLINSRYCFHIDVTKFNCYVKKILFIPTFPFQWYLFTYPSIPTQGVLISNSPIIKIDQNRKVDANLIFKLLIIEIIKVIIMIFYADYVI